MSGGTVLITPRVSSHDNVVLNDFPVPVETHSAPGGVTSEIVAVIEAAVTAFVGKKATILSVRVLNQPEGESNAWASQGRDMVQSSHNIVQRGH
jgi:hypothetical protein